MSVADAVYGFIQTPTGGRRSHGSAETLSAGWSVVSPSRQPPVVEASPDWLFETEIEVKELALLSEGWDGDVADPVSVPAIERALGLLRTFSDAGLVPLIPKPRIVPTVNSGVAIAWSNQVARLEFEIHEDGDISVAASSPDGQVETNDPEEAPPAFAVMRYFMAHGA